MPILIFSPVHLFMRHPLVVTDRDSNVFKGHCIGNGQIDVFYNQLFPMVNSSTWSCAGCGESGCKRL